MTQPTPESLTLSAKMDEVEASLAALRGNPLYAKLVNLAALIAVDHASVKAVIEEHPHPDEIVQRTLEEVASNIKESVHAVLSLAKEQCPDAKPNKDMMCFLNVFKSDMKAATND